MEKIIEQLIKDSPIIMEDIWNKEKQKFDHILKKYNLKDAWDIVDLFEKKTAKEILEGYRNKNDWTISDKDILYAMEEYAKEYHNKNEIKLQDSDCTCWGDHNGFMTNPNCILHGKR